MTLHHLSPPRPAVERMMPQKAYAGFLKFAEPTPELVQFVAGHRLPQREISASTLMAVAPVTAGTDAKGDFFSYRQHGAGPNAAIVECRKGTTPDDFPFDFVAWPVASPEHWRTALGLADILGAQNLNDSGNRPPLPIWKTPLEYLQAGCAGICLLAGRGVQHLANETRPLVARDPAHAALLRDLIAQWAPEQAGQLQIIIEPNHRSEGTAA